MPVVTEPTSAEVQRLGGINVSIENVSSGALDTTIDAIVDEAVIEVALAIGEATYDLTTHTPRVASAIELAIAHVACGKYWRRIQGFKLAGVHEPLVMEDSDRFQAKATEHEAKAAELVTLLTTGTTTTPFALPAFASSTFTPTTTTGPTDKFSQLDERDDIWTGNE